MLRFEEEEKTSPAIIKVLGIGGGGMNAVARMANSSLRGVEYVIMNTDEQVLRRSNIENKITLGSKTTRGMGAGGDPDLGTKAAEEDRERIISAIQGSDMVFVTAGMGGGTGTGAAPIVAKIAKEMKCLVVGVVTIPFSFEGKRRMELAKRGVEQLRAHVDTLILVNNESIFQVVDRNTPIDQAFRVIDDILLNAVRGISDIVNNPGLINVDFADVKTIMKDTGDAVMGVGEGSGENKVSEAVNYAIDNALLDSRSIAGATSLLINVTGGTDLTISDWNEVSQIITSQVDPNANIIVGLTEDPELERRIRVTVIATGFHKRPSGLGIPTKTQPQRKVVGLEETEEPRPSFRSEPERLPDADAYRGLKARSSQTPAKEDYDIPAFLRRNDRNRG
ncbi:cell division protein FtsZ [Leptospira wolffii]|uniref:cell division protein FtsZ n=1 Tax=Leptospira wolffii TaxID=409998 RepID=UPI0002D4D3B9|nr:cell division protein FtsZ [Leptospira wolffii]EPG65626.1 cell division protein FtsZ [Leptospira wolffii serovar Khorat str. Khorat-H2]